MSDISTGPHHNPGRYEIRLKGHLDSRWAAWFDGLSLTNSSDGTTRARPPLEGSPSFHGCGNPPVIVSVHTQTGISTQKQGASGTNLGNPTAGPVWAFRRPV